MNAYLTIDDAPSETLAKKLDVLTTHDIPAVLFCEGRRLSDYPALAEQAVRAGIHLGNHTYTHTHASDLSAETFEEEVARTEQRIEAVYERTGISRPARIFRFPYGDEGGELADQFQCILREHGFTPPNRGEKNANRTSRVDWSWTISVADWTTDDASELNARLDSAISEAQQDDEIVLFHDAGNAPSLFEAFVTRLHESDRVLSDPLDLI